MLAETTCFRKIYLAPGKTDLRKGIDGLASVVSSRFNLDPFEKNILFLFCGTSSNKIKGLVWEGDGFVLVYKRVQSGHYQWPRNTEEVMQLDQKQLQDLLSGLSIISTIKPAKPAKYL